MVTPQTNTTLSEIAERLKALDDFVICGHVHRPAAVGGQSDLSPRHGQRHRSAVPMGAFGRRTGRRASGHCGDAAVHSPHVGDLHAAAAAREPAAAGAFVGACGGMKWGLPLAVSRHYFRE